MLYVKIKFQQKKETWRGQVERNNNLRLSSAQLRHHWAAKHYHDRILDFQLKNLALLHSSHKIEQNFWKMQRMWNILNYKFSRIWYLADIFFFPSKQMPHFFWSLVNPFTQKGPKNHLFVQHTQRTNRWTRCKGSIGFVIRRMLSSIRNQLKNNV